MNPELRARCLDFARRYIHIGLSHYTCHRRALLWNEAEGFLQYCIDERCTGWEKGPDSYTMPCDIFDEHFEGEGYQESDAKWEKGRTNRFYEVLRFACRVAFDVVDHFPGGTLGLTVGIVRRMYGGTIPQWFCQPWLDETPEHVDLNNVDENQILFV